MAKKNGKGDPYDVGYGKTPKHTRWPKGVSGNPSGKKKKEESFMEKLNKIAGEEIIVGKNGTPVAMTNLEAMFYTAFQRAQNGNPQFFRALMKELGGEETANWFSGYEIGEADIEVLETEADFRRLIDAARTTLEAAEDLDGAEFGGHDDPEDTF